ncbi:MAG: alpha/beta hydrolase [Ilumatobacteraceae bacterium]|nr:alpha/beta hydrolase [Ilumatobacteraceae bacterium]
MSEVLEIRNGEVPLHVEVDGDPGAPPLLLLHGITSSGRTWEWFVPRLAERHRVLRLDFRGHGRSGRAPGAYDVAGYVSDAAAACEQAVGGPCVVMGHSLGGGTAVTLAQLHPEWVSALVLEDPPIAPADDHAALDDNSLIEAFRLMREMVPQMQAGGMTVDALAGLLAGMPTAAGRSMAESVHADAITATAASLLDLDAAVLDPLLERSIRPVFDPHHPLDVPTLLITADPASPDCVARPADVARLTAASTTVEVVTPPGATHLIHDELTHRDAFAAAVLAFLQRVRA